MGGFSTTIEQSNKEKDRTHPCYEATLRRDNTREQPSETPTPKNISLDELEDYISLVIDELEKFKENPFVMMENKKVWFDRATSALFPRFEAVKLPHFPTVNRPLRNFSGWQFEGLTFYPMTVEECKKSFIIGKINPYLSENGTFENFPTELKRIILVDGGSGKKSLCLNTSGIVNYYSDLNEITLVPIFRLNGMDSEHFGHGRAVVAWLTYDLIPEGLSPEAKKAYTFLMKIFSDVRSYFTTLRGLSFAYRTFRKDVESGKIDFSALVAKGFGVGLPNVKAKKGNSQPVDLLREELCKCDYIRANITPYDKKILTDPNGGHWELFEPPASDAEIIELPKDEPFFARPPQMDVKKGGIVAIDFGTKSTVVVRQLGTDEKLLRIGEGDFSKAPEKKDYENPTVIELRDYEAFKAAYDEREGRPFTKWTQATFSHTAAAVLNDAENDTSIDSSVFYSIFSDLKQWANDKNLRMYLQDRKKHLVELNPYLQLNDEDFDPIELYAYYLGLYINNMHTGICLEYLFSFPVTYEEDVRKRILSSFERGIKKSLPPAILQDDALLKRFKFTLCVNEPAAYAACALRELGLQPKPDKKTAYAVFDFGGGTTDFDFGIMSIDPSGRSKFIINQCPNVTRGDSFLGGENLLNLIAYEIYKLNLPFMREKQIPFALPYDCVSVDGGDTIILSTKEAFLNRKRIAEFLRPFWEGNADADNELFDEKQTLKLYSNKDDKVISVELEMNRKLLEDCLTERIKRGVNNFFEALIHAFRNPEVLPIHILLAGNSCKSSVVRNLFEEKILEKELELEEIIARKTGQSKKVSNVFELHMPLGFNPDEENNADNEIRDADEEPVKPQMNQNYERLRTGKTGVAFGLLRCRKGAHDVKVIGVQEGVAPFLFYLGTTDYNDCFEVKIALDVPYGKWTKFTFADSDNFDIYFTKAADAFSGNMKRSEVNSLSCYIDEDDVSEEDDVFVYVRKAAPDKIEYAVGRAEDFADDNFNGKIYSETISD